MTHDCFMLFNELDILEIRLNILDPYVDCFVIGQSEETFSGKTKPLYLLTGDERFAKWRHKIKYVICPKVEGNPFQRAGFQKDYLRQQLDAQSEDIVYFGDADEIWTPQTITDDKVYNLRQLNYCYHLNQRSSEEWIGTIVGKWKNVKLKSFNHWRANRDNVIDGGWHFTNVGGKDQILMKLDAYDHQEYNTDEVKAELDTRISLGEDYVGRSTTWQGKPFEMWEDEVDLPQYLKDNKTKWTRLFLS